MNFFPLSSRSKRRRRRLVSRLIANESGATAIEFAFVGPLLLAFVLGLISFGLYFFTDSSLAYGVESASRKIRTGEVNSTGTKRADQQMTFGEFEKNVCTAAGPLIDCGKLRVHVDSKETWAAISPPSCSKADGSMTASTGATNDLVSQYSGGASQVVLATVCYNWDDVPIFKIFTLPVEIFFNLPTMLQAAAAFKSEPYS